MIVKKYTEMTFVTQNNKLFAYLCFIHSLTTKSIDLVRIENRTTLCRNTIDNYKKISAVKSSQVKRNRDESSKNFNSACKFAFPPKYRVI